MATHATIETILRDDDDLSGQTIREWKIQAEASHIVVRLNHGDGFLMLRPSDIDAFVYDLREAAEFIARWNRRVPRPESQSVEK